MKRALLLAAAIMLSPGVASAADMAVKARPVLPPVAVYNWTGCYVGADVGGVWGGAYDLRVDAKAGSIRDPAIRNGIDEIGAVSGTVHGGCNYQFASKWVVGFEGDYTWFGDRHSAANLPITSGGASNGANYVTRLDQTSGLASVRARLGYGFDKTLLYGTAGAAWLRTSVFGESAAGACLGICDAVATFDDWGAVVGGGAEYAITPNIVLRAEYLYYFLGRSHSVVAACPAAGCAAFSDTPHTYTWRTQDVQQARVGVSWKFGGPVVAKY